MVEPRDPGQPLRVPCPSCGAQPDETDRFCTACGFPLSRVGRGLGRPRTRTAVLALLAVLIIGTVVVGLRFTVQEPVGVPAAPAGDSSATSASPSSVAAKNDLDLGQPFGVSYAADDTFCFGMQLECVTLTVPVDHRSPTSADAMQVRFGLHGARDEPMGTLVIATGGPGSSGIEAASFYLTVLPASVTDRFDLVFFEQRGVGQSEAIECADAGLTFPGLTAEAGEDIADAVGLSSAWVERCLREADIGDPAALDRYETYQAAADLDAYLDTLGAGKVILFGESYGTELVQAYARQRPDRVAGLILDGPVDTTLSPLERAVEQAAAFSEVLDLTLGACADDRRCAEDFGSEADPYAAWDTLAATLRLGPIPVELPSRDGAIGTELTLERLMSTTAATLYTEWDRMMLLRGLAAASHDDLRPLVRLAALTAGLDPETGQPLPHAEGSPAPYYAILCQDYDPSVRRGIDDLAAGVALLRDDGARLADVAFHELPCMTGFAGARGPHDLGRTPEVDIPTLVLSSSADPATPLAWARSIADRAPNVHLVVTDGGSHTSFGYGLPCPDDIVKEFLVFGDLPAERETSCPGYVTEPYAPRPLGGPDAYADVLDALVEVEVSIRYLPDYAYWDGSHRQLGCPYGGWMQMVWRGHDEFRLYDCQLLPEWPLNGLVTFNADLSTVMDLTLPNGELHYTSSDTWDVSVSGTLDGVEIDLSR